MSIFPINPCHQTVTTGTIFSKIGQNKHQFLAEKAIFTKIFRENSIEHTFETG